MVDLESLYLKLPVPLQHLTCSLEGWRIQRTRFGSSFRNQLEQAENRTFWSEERIRDYRDQRLRDIVQHAVRTVPFYRRWFHECGVSPDDIQTLEDLNRLPILTKDVVQDNYPELVSEAISKRDQVAAHTSGTTGGGLRFATTSSSMQEQWAIWWRYRRWQGIQLNTWCGYFGGRSVVPSHQDRPPFWRYNRPGRQILFSAYHMSPVNLSTYVDVLRDKKPPWLHGYPSLLALLAAYILDSGIDIDYRIRWVTLGAENLLAQQADLIERAFGTRPIQNYGMAEAVANASQCEDGLLHVDEDFAAVEFVPNPDGLGYKVVGTNFTNMAMPLIRYDTQDVVTLSDTTCVCGRPGRVVTGVDGRLEDYIVLKNGAHIGRMDHIFKDMLNIREAQVFQDTPGEIVIRIVRGQCYTDADEQSLLRETRKRIGEDCGILINYTDELERSSTGKLRFVVSNLKDGKLGQARL